MICIVIFIYYIILFVNIIIFDIELIYLKILYLKVLINLSATIDFPLLCAEYISISLFSDHEFIDLLQNLLPLSSHILFGLRFDSSKIF